MNKKVINIFNKTCKYCNIKFKNINKREKKNIYIYYDIIKSNFRIICF